MFKNFIWRRKNPRRANPLCLLSGRLVWIMQQIEDQQMEMKWQWCQETKFRTEDCKELSKNKYSWYRMPWVALYWEGISIRAARANAASFFDISLLVDIISVKFTNCNNLSISLEEQQARNWNYNMKSIYSEDNAKKKKYSCQHNFSYSNSEMINKLTTLCWKNR